MYKETDFLEYRLKQTSTTIAELLKIGGTPGLSLGVFNHGRIIHMEHFGKRDVEYPESPNDDSIYWVASTFKVVTASAFARLVTDGILGWDVPVREYIRELRDRNDVFGTKVTVRDLLANQSGLAMANFYWVEAVTGKAFGDFVRECIFDPLELGTPTFDSPTGMNIMMPHGSRDDGSACKVNISTFDSASGLAAGAGGKSGIKDHVRLYIALLAAYNHQLLNDTDTTAGSPFTQVRTIFTPQVPFPGSEIEKQAYCLGLYRTKLPGNLSRASLNASLPSERLSMLTKARGNASNFHEEVYHHSCTTPGFVGAMFLVPRTQSGVVVMTNGTPRMDVADLSAQLLLSELLGFETPDNTLDAAKTIVETQLGWYHKMATFLESCKTGIPPTHPLEAYTGIYWNGQRNFKIVVAVQGAGLRVSVQGMPVTTYVIQPCDGDTFYWPASRENEVVERGMWVNPFPQFHLIKFTCNAKRVLSLEWKHEKVLDAERFFKGGGDIEARL